MGWSCPIAPSTAFFSFPELTGYLSAMGVGGICRFFLSISLSIGYIMGYKQALITAGADVLAFEEFGSYQGDWLAKVRYERDTFWVKDYYGSCTGCDAYEAEFGFSDPTTEEVAAFGRRYLEPEERHTYEEILELVGKDGWDSSSDEMVAFVKANK